MYFKTNNVYNENETLVTFKNTILQQLVSESDSSNGSSDTEVTGSNVSKY